MKSSPDSPSDTPSLHRRLRLQLFSLEALNGLSTAYYFNYLFFYLQKHFGFGNRDNLLTAGLYGLIYMFITGYAGPFGQKRGYFFALRIGFAGMMVTMVLGALAPEIWSYSHRTLVAEIVIMIFWTMALCFTWPTLQALLSQRQSSVQASRTAGVYNMVWAGTSALAYLTSGFLLDNLGGEILFWIPAAIHLIQLIMLPSVQKLSMIAETIPLPEERNAISATVELNPRPISRARKFVQLALVANPFAYVAIYGVLPVIPVLAEHFDLTPGYAGLICSIWFWTRLVAFIWFWLWPGWHYRFSWLVGAFIAMIASFIAILLSTTILLLVVGQIIFGLTIGLIYYSSLFYAMDAGESKGKRGGFHEAAIGLGIFIGPMAGVGAIHLFPNHPNADTWGIAVLLVAGLAIFCGIQLRDRAQAAPHSALP